MFDTAKTIDHKDYKIATLVDDCATISTATPSTNFRSVPTSRRDGVVKLRLSSREIPDRITATTTA